MVFNFLLLSLTVFASLASEGSEREAAFNVLTVSLF
jgi:hypothetical protein